jgi:hypothetical protein
MAKDKNTRQRQGCLAEKILTKVREIDKKIADSGRRGTGGENWSE